MKTRLWKKRVFEWPHGYKFPLLPRRVDLHLRLFKRGNRPHMLIVRRFYR